MSHEMFLTHFPKIKRHFKQCSLYLGGGVKYDLHMFLLSFTKLFLTEHNNKELHTLSVHKSNW